MKPAKWVTMFVLLWSVISGCAAPATPPDSNSPASQNSIEPTLDSGPRSYEGNGLTVYLKAEFPQTPATMNVYTVKGEELATADSARSLAAQFKMNGPVYELDAQSGIPGVMLAAEREYLVADGNRQLRVRSDKYFIYVPDTVSRTDNLFATVPSNAEETITKFMQEYGFTSPYRIEQADPFNYAALALSLDGFSLHYGGLQFNGLRFHFDKNGIAQVDASLLNYEQTASMEIISAEDALQKLLDPRDTFGYIQGGGGSGFLMVGDTILKPEDFRKWTHVRPLDETITYNGYLSSTGKSVDGGTPLVMLDGYPVSGQVADIPENMQYVYVEARGQFHEVDGVKTFELKSWKKSEGYKESVFGVLRLQNGQFVLEDEAGKEYILQDVPADISLPMEPAFARGVTRGEIFDWNVIDNNGGGGGGGGGGGYSGFYKINFSGTPVPFPLAVSASATPEPILKYVEGLRGSLQVNLFPQADGSTRAGYLFLPYDSEYGGTYYQLQGNIDGALQSLHNRPIDVWGKMDSANNQITVGRYENPFPDLKFELIKGSQRLETIEGQPVTLVTAEEGTKYIVLTTIGALVPMQLSDPAFVPDPSSPSSVPSPNADNVIYEALIIPGETYLGYPGMRVFNSAPGIVDGKPNTLEIVNDQPTVFPGPPQVSLTSMTIEKIELAYFAPDNLYSSGQTFTDPVYVQPVWRFYGHYNDGSPFEILIQALQPQYLLPEVDASTAP